MNFLGWKWKPPLSKLEERLRELGARIEGNLSRKQEAIFQVSDAPLRREL